MGCGSEPRRSGFFANEWKAFVNNGPDVGVRNGHRSAKKVRYNHQLAPIILKPLFAGTKWEHNFRIAVWIRSRAGISWGLKGV